ncbi:hypothetical protein QQ213_004296 [Vibrio vulnificus]|uniref:hypothetical protein n=1 Tax=Vibrio harveyi group TaxID=717610 RepID=UPI00111016CE|nr:MULTISPECIES: hypothetical protein [Vibrio harveyi group]ELS0754452.1 hypothetical protein [Vibrio vulnificus]ELB2073869.1 hypothetical protein [Vibrio parahaemolyticus]MCS0154710.1 hypothetical protein [Vibrio alginolyticus]TMX33732.1 hypothetical protein DA095_16505 [Vibrio rotiferianus]TMX54837.1 hypothetical protein DA093_08780 [Vibrio rotiferianus]
MSYIKLSIVCLFVVVFVLVTMYFGNYWFADYSGLQNTSNALNIVNVMFTGLAFSAAGIAVYIQAVQLKETRQSLKEAEEVQNQSIATQAKILEIQRLQAEALIKSKQVEITAILKSSPYSNAISPQFKAEIDEIINKINS